MSFQRQLASGKFVVLAEMNTPKGVNVSELVANSRRIKGRVDAVTIPDMDNGVMRMSALAGGALIHQQGMEAIIHVYCRDRNRMALQGDLLAAHMLGIRNLIVVPGEEMANGDHRDAVEVGDIDERELIGAIQSLQNGLDMAGFSLNGSPEFTTGCTLGAFTDDRSLELELEKLKSRDEIVVDLKKINISSILTDMVQRSKISAKIKKIKIDFTPIKEDLYIKGSKKQIEILFSILLENAINYSPSKSVVKIITKRIEGPRIYIGIEDQGIGIPEKNIGNVFNEFFRSNNAVDFHKNGTGLGLSVAREIINIHNASINVESVLEKGSCFSVAFKLL